MTDRNYIEYDLQEFILKKSNILFVTGFIGSGKTTLANSFGERYNATVIHLDDLFDHNKAHVLSIPKKDKELLIKLLIDCGFYKYIDKDLGIYTGRYELLSCEDRCREIIRAAIKRNETNCRIILEGVQLYVYTSLIDEYKDYPIVILSTNSKDSMKSDYARAINQGVKRKYLIKDKGNQVVYYDRQNKNLKEYLNNLILKREENNMESVLEALLRDENGEIATEGFFVDSKKLNGKIVSDVDDYYWYGNKNGTYAVYKANFIPKVMEAWGLCSDSFIEKKGVNLFNKLATAIKKGFDYSTAHAEEYHTKFVDGKLEDCEKIRKEFYNIFSEFSSINKSVTDGNKLYSGVPTAVPDDVKKEMAKSFAIVFEVMGPAAKNAKDKIIKTTESKATIKKIFHKKSILWENDSYGYFWFETYLFCKDFLSMFFKEARMG